MSDWIASVTESGDRKVLGRVNDGADRQDARWFPRFQTGWRRAAVPLRQENGQSFTALGLVRDDSPDAVVELDDHSRPILVSPAGLRAVVSVERRWPADVLTDQEQMSLGAESLALRHALVDRLDAEGHPAPEVYWLLPWALLAGFATQLAAALRTGAPRPQARLRHWFAPAGERLTAAMEQINEGVRTADGGLVEAGTGALLRRLQRAEIARIAPPARVALADLVEAASRESRFLDFWGRRVRNSLSGFSPDLDVTRIRLSSEQAALASGRQSTGTTSGILKVPPFVVTLRVGGTMVTILIDTTGDVPPGEAVFLPIEIVQPGGRQRLFVPVSRRSAGFSGRMEVRDIHGAYQVVVSEPPLSLAEMAELGDEEIAPSLRPFRYMTDRPGRDAWVHLAGRLAPGNPLIRVITTAVEEMP